MSEQKSGAKEADEKLLAAVLEAYEFVKDRVQDLGKSKIRLTESADLTLRLSRANFVSLAAEALAGAAKELHETIDAALIKTMDATGATQITDPDMTLSLVKSGGGVEFEPAAVPPEFMTTPAPVPDRKRIKQALKDGTELNWARLTEGKLGLRRTTR